MQGADAKEVILIIPRGSKLAKQAGYFEAFSKEAEGSAKLISIMTEDPKIEELAEAHGLYLLASPKKAKPSKKPAVKHAPVELAEEEAPVRTYYASTPEANPDESEIDESTGEPRVQTAVWTKNQEIEDFESEGEESATEPTIVTIAARSSRRSMQDVVSGEQENLIKVRGEDKKAVAVSVKKPVTRLPEPTSREEKIEEIWAEKRQEAKQKRSRGGTKRSNLVKKVVLGFVAIVIVLGGIVYFFPASAKIEILTKKESVDFKINVVSSPNISGVNVAVNQIPGQKFTVSKEVSDTFPATGQKDVAQNARGTIKIFNNNVGKPQILSATTRFETPAGLIFRIPSAITVPGATRSTDSKITPGTIDSVVVANYAGLEYNIGPSSFKVPGFKGTPNYEQFSAISSAPMTGGIIGPAKVVTEQDFSKTQAQLEQKLKEQVQSGLKEQIVDMTLIEQGNNVKLDAPVTNVKAGEAADKLEMKIRGSAEIVAFRDADLDQLITNYLGKKGNFGLAHSKLKKDFESAVYDPKTGQLTFTVHVTGQAAAVIDEKKITSDIVGKSGDEIKAYFAGVKELASVKVLLSPFWVGSVPRDTGRIKLTVE